jgi:DNA-binding beta-propeller fold protein YncE
MWIGIAPEGGKAHDVGKQRELAVSERGNAIMQAQHSLFLSFSAATFLAIASFSHVQAAPFLIVGNDEKLLWDDNGKPIVSPAGKDSVVILDVANPEDPKIIANLPLKNSVVGPPVNVAIDPSNSVALVADSMDVTKDGNALKMDPDNKVYVIDLKANPPKLANTVTVGKQPSGLSFNPTGNLALVANRADKSISVLSVKGTDVKVIDTVDMGDIVSHVVFTPDGKRALATKFNAHKVSLLDVNGDKVSYTSLTCQPVSGPTMSMWRRAEKLLSQRTTAVPAPLTAVSTL